MSTAWIEKLEAISRRREEIGDQMADPRIIADNRRYAELSRKYSELGELSEAYTAYRNILSNLESSRSILETEKDAELKEMALSEIASLQEAREKMEDKIRLLLIPKDPEDARDAIIEIRAGTGGDEAGIFAGDLYRMYTRFCESKGWKIEAVDHSEGTAGGFREVVFNVRGNGVYGILKYESGVHRVQRVPKTETQGRVHTSAASVVVLPEAEEFDVELKDSDIRRDTFCSSGPGGQSVNTTYSAVRLTHIPTGVVATCQDEKSQIKNYNKALSVLRSRIYEIELRKRMEERSRKRKTMISTGDRSAKIRTYNYPQGRVTEHRIGLTIYNLQAVMNGDLGELNSALQMAENAERLKEEME